MRDCGAGAGAERRPSPLTSPPRLLGMLCGGAVYGGSGARPQRSVKFEVLNISIHASQGARAEMVCMLGQAELARERGEDEREAMIHKAPCRK